MLTLEQMLLLRESAALVAARRGWVTEAISEQQSQTTSSGDQGTYLLQ